MLIRYSYCQNIPIRLVQHAIRSRTEKQANSMTTVAPQDDQVDVQVPCRLQYSANGLPALDMDIPVRESILSRKLC